MFLLSDYHYTLPLELIAQEAAHPHHDARMMVIDQSTGQLAAESTFWNLDRYLGGDRVLFFNDSRVVRSRIILESVSYQKIDWNKWILGSGEIFYISSISDTTFEALVRPGNKFRVGTIFTVGIYNIVVTGINENGRILEIRWWDILSFLADHGSLPLPPYIEYTQEKELDYQTSFAKIDGSVAAPTASLHFTRELMDKIKYPKEYLTLHVGLGTFKGIQTHDIRDYAIHRERVEVSVDIFVKITLLKERNQKIVAVGTTATRTLESLPYLWKEISQDIIDTLDAKTRKYWNTLILELEEQLWIHNPVFHHESWNLHFETSIYITPGYTFRIVDDLITNFHLGESSLLVLVSAFLGYEETMRIYQYAVENRYRFYSFGDGMYIRSK